MILFGYAALCMCILFILILPGTVLLSLIAFLLSNPIYILILLLIYLICKRR